MRPTSAAERPIYWIARQ